VAEVDLFGYKSLELIRLSWNNSTTVKFRFQSPIRVLGWRGISAVVDSGEAGLVVGLVPV
jgi:hypothetical protein